MVFFGDGAIDEGVYHECLNFASIKKLPILFICENNGYAVHSATRARRNSDNICEHARVYGLTADRIEGNDVLAINKRVGEAVDAIRSGESGPQLLEIMTYRWMEHVGPGEDFNLGYRTPEEREPWVEDDQIPKLRAQIEEEIVTGIDAEVETEVEAAFEFAENSPYPEPEELYQHVYG